MNVQRFLSAVGASAVIALAIPASSPADISIDVSPAKYELGIPTGQSQTIPITIRNTTDAPVHILASLSDFAVGVNGSYVFTPAGQSKYSMGKWVSLNPREFDLAPNTFTQVRLSVDVPGGAAGEYSTMIFFTTRPTRHQGGLSIAERVASKIYELVPDSGKLAAEIDDVSAKATGDGSHVLVGLRNTGTAHFYVSGSVQVKQGDQLVERISLPQNMLVERAGKRVIEVSGKRLPPGSYTAIAMLDYGGPSLIAGKTSFTVH